MNQTLLRTPAPAAAGAACPLAAGWVGADMLDPIGELPMRADGDKAWFGWPKDDKIEQLRAQWLKAATLDERKKLAAEIQQRAFETVPYIPTAQHLLLAHPPRLAASGPAFTSRTGVLLTWLLAHSIEHPPG